MQLFLDTADTTVVRDLAASGLIDGVTTNPSLIAKSGGDFFDTIRVMASLVSGPVSAEVTSTESATMIEEGQRLARLAPNVAVKVPLTWDGLRACRSLADQAIKVNVTLCFSTNQALLAAKAGAAFVSPFIGRLDDIGENGMGLISEIKTIFGNYPAYGTKVLVASVRSVDHVKAAALIGADIATVPPAIIKEMISHPLTDKGLRQFIEDWKKTGQRILGR